MSKQQPSSDSSQSHIFAKGIRATYRLDKTSSTAPLELVQEMRLPLEYETLLSFIAFIGACRQPEARGVAAYKVTGEWTFDYNPDRHPLQHFQFTYQHRTIAMANSSAYRLMDALLPYKEAHEQVMKQGNSEAPKSQQPDGEQP
jgi:hypothetical protein